MDNKEKMAALVRRHIAASHAMQAGVAMMMNYDGGPVSGATSPKHLRVGVNVALSDHAALAKLLVAKGVISEEEYLTAICEQMEAEKASYEQRLTEMYGGKTKVTLG